MMKRMVMFGTVFLFSVFINIVLLHELLNFALNNDFSTHILLIPFISLFLIFRGRREIFMDSPEYWLPGIGVLLFGTFLAGPWMKMDLSIKAFGLILLWGGAFLFVFGKRVFRRALFPFLFLALMIPIPGPLLQRIIALLQRGSAEVSNILFTLTGIPFYREGTFFALPGVNIDIAPQCSSIRSSIALLITSLLAAYLMLESGWRRILFVVVSIPMAIMKNAVRIVTLSLLAVRVDKGWLTDSGLHQEGGILFFILALLLMFPLLWFLRRSELESKDKGSVQMETK